MSAVDIAGAGGRLRVRVAPTRGAEVTQVSWDGRELLETWASPAPPPPETAAELESSRTTWLSTYTGGWQELLPNAGSAGEVRGVRHPFHGEASTASWQVVGRSEHEIVLSWSSPVVPLAVSKKIVVDPERPRLSIETTLRNLDQSHQIELLWGHHPTFKVVPPAELSWTCACVSDGHCAGAAGPVTEAVPPGRRSQVRTCRVGAGSARLRRGDGITVALSWDTGLLPYLWVWLETAPETWPFPDDVCLAALEPQRSSRTDGIASAVGRGEELVLSPGGSHTLAISLTIEDLSLVTSGIDRRDRVA